MQTMRIADLRSSRANAILHRLPRAPRRSPRESAARRWRPCVNPSPIAPGPEGSWPLRFDRLVGPVLEKSCVSCHAGVAAGANRPAPVSPGGHAGGSSDQRAARFDLTAPNAYRSLLGYAGDDLKKLAFERTRSSSRRVCGEPEQASGTASPARRSRRRPPRCPEPGPAGHLDERLCPEPGLVQRGPGSRAGAAPPAVGRDAAGEVVVSG